MLTVDEKNQIQQLNDIKSVLDLEPGRRFMWRVISYCGIYKALEGDHDDMMKQEGRRQIGLYLLGLLTDVDDEQVFNMMREAKNKDMGDNYDRKIERDIDDRDSEGSDSSHSYSGNILDEYI